MAALEAADCLDTIEEEDETIEEVDRHSDDEDYSPAEETGSDNDSKVESFEETFKFKLSIASVSLVTYCCCCDDHLRSIG